MLYSIRMRAQANQLHISGAEDICTEDAIHNEAADLLLRALNHPRGKPDAITISVERLDIAPRKIPALPVVTCQVEDPGQGRHALWGLLSGVGIADGIITKALELIHDNDSISGAYVLDAQSGRRLEPDPSRGIRVSRLGITQQAREQLITQLQKLITQLQTDGVYNNIAGFGSRIIEAVVLASKVASDGAVAAELCIPDNPDYTTGYVASERFGYVRIAHIKPVGSHVGGRVFFVRPELSVDVAVLKDFIYYMERVPVIVDSVSAYGGTSTLDEIIGTV
ncbi:6-carboxyhexanoate--CoA ligase [Candidatus Magnetobacterium bavaricum]|uniref:6-carboxyhexanoate--CoA ligase n=1 Tax=Candidatus Magnetobacterium bavaricum TaxID=29290 RepID=A0A0F3GS58_9BACT|nr:6-carboxyhexanoate--CoA ligase [Candidatus Magnetobacterium bavaricum]